MSEEPLPDLEEEKPARPLHPQLRRFLLTMCVLAVFWLIFGQIVPRVMFETRPKRPVAAQPQQTEPPANYATAPEPTPVEQAATAPAEAPATAPVQEPAAAAEVAIPAATQEHIAKLEERITTLEAALANLPPPPEPTPPFDPSGLEAQIATVKAEASVVKTDVEALKNAPDMQAQIRQLAWMNLVAQIKEASARAEPFPAAQLQLAGLAEGHAKARELVALLAPYASEPPPTGTQLASRFDGASDKALRPAKGEHSLEGNLSALIRVRKVGTPTGTDDKSVIARAESQLNEGSLNGALKELTALSPEASDAMSAWIHPAQARMALNALLDALSLTLLSEDAITVPAQ